MFETFNKQINRLQPSILRPEDEAELAPGSYVPILSDIILPSFAMAISMFVLRKLFDRFIVVPFGAYFDIKETVLKQHYIRQPVLESEYIKNKSPKDEVIFMLCKKTGMTERQVQVWFRKRRKDSQASDLKRLSDAGWSFIFYSLLSWYGLYVLWDKPWLTNSMDCWIGWPAQAVTNDVYWYYLVELGFYMSYLYMIFTDHKRKDFMEFLVHHSVTVALMILSWSINCVRIGTLVLVIHDQVDYLLALAKIAVYIKMQKMADIVFALFLPMWIITRLMVYPYVVLYSIYIDLPAYANDSRPYLQMHDRSTIGQVLKSLLVVLQILHVMWTIIILKSAATKFTKGKLQDTRSDTEEEDENEANSETIDNKSNYKISNGNSVIGKNGNVMEPNGNSYSNGRT